MNAAARDHSPAAAQGSAASPPGTGGQRPPREAAGGLSGPQRALSLQWWLGRLAAFVLVPLSYLVIRLMGYRVKDLRAVRRSVAARMAAHDGPWIVCANHLTMVDSWILVYVMAPFYRYLRDYRMLPWNVPEQANFQRSIFSSIYCYLGKCIPIRRRGNREQVRAVLGKIVYLLRRKEVIMVFPEGTRSRSGRVDFQNVTYGVGRFLQNVPGCRVLCIYLRGKGQASYGFAPRFGERFHVDVADFQPVMTESGLRGQRAGAMQIIARLAEMEKRHFEPYRQ